MEIASAKRSRQTTTTSIKSDVSNLEGMAAQVRVRSNLTEETVLTKKLVARINGACRASGLHQLSQDDHL